MPLDVEPNKAASKIETVFATTVLELILDIGLSKLVPIKSDRRQRQSILWALRLDEKPIVSQRHRPTTAPRRGVPPVDTVPMKPWLSLIIPGLGLVSVLAYLAWGTIGRDRGQQEPPALAAAPGVPPDVPQGEPLIVVSISPEARVKASAGDATPALEQGAWTEFPIEIQNAALMTAPIVVESAQAMVDDGDLSRDRWLKIDLMPPGQLSGQREERRTLRIWSRDSGIRAAVFNVNAGQGTQDLGFRSDVLITFDVTPSDSQPAG